MRTTYAFLLSREFRQLCVYGAMLLLAVLGLVALHMLSLRRRPPEKPSHPRRKKGGKSRAKGR
ncbi:MAG: hypothetical protein IJ646_07410 [Clostridia bacterium]|nr:hypothetical protein [Clostridia bacterium]